MDFRKTVREFYREFEKMNLDGVLSFFAPHAIVHSPTLGKKEATAFYPELFSKTKHIQLVIKDLFVSSDHPHRLAAYVNFTTTWKKGENRSSTFEGVVIFELNPQGKIQHLEIIYDAQRAREELSHL